MKHLPIIFSLVLHSLLASFLILPAQFSEIKPIAIEIFWEEPKNVCQSEEVKELSLEPQKIIKVQKSSPPLKIVTERRSVLSERVVINVNKESIERTPIKIVKRKAHQPLPAYPWVCRKRRQEGTVLLKVNTNEEGQVVDVSLHKSSGHTRLDEVALVAVKSWIFSDTRTQKVLSIVFRLKA